MDEFDDLTVRNITLPEINELNSEELVYVKEQGFDELTLIPVHLTGAADDGGFFPYQSIFQAAGLAPFDGIFVADEAGDKGRVLRSAGTRVSLTLFFPGMGEEVLVDLYSALREKFGTGLVERWEESANLVSALKHDVYEIVTVKQGRGKTREEHETRILRASGLLLDQARAVEGESGGRIVVELHKPVVRQAPTI